MKQTWKILLAVLLAVSLTACTSAESPEEERNETAFRATVLSIGDGSMVVEPVEGAEELRSTDQISVALEHMSVSPEPQVGDTVEITYNGEIMESYPAQLGEVYGIAVVEKAPEPREEPKVKAPEEELPEAESPEQSEAEPKEPERAEYGYEDVYMALVIPVGWSY